MNKTYAQVLFDCVNDHDLCAYNLLQLDQAFDQLAYQFFQTQTITKQEKKEIIDALALDDKYITNFLKILIDDNKMNKFPEIVNDYRNIYLKNENIICVNVEVAHNLDDSMYQHILNSLEKQLDKYVILKVDINPQIIGGIKISYDDKVIDNSINYQLQQLERIIKKEVI